jgi:UTP--glucose-1-phosphate uridylyltransferase
MNKPEDYKRYGYAGGKEIKPGILSIDEIIEKPGVGMIDSDYALIGGSVYEPEMFNAIEEAMRRLEHDNTPRELVYIDAVNILLERGKACHAVEIQGGRYHDCGNKLEYLKTVVEYGLRHGDLKDGFGEYLKSLSL